MGWKNLNRRRRSWNPLSLFHTKNQTQLLRKWLNPKPIFSQHKNKLIQAATHHHHHHHRLASAIPEWPSPILGQAEETLKVQVNRALASRRFSFERDESCSILATAGFPFKECEVVAVETEDPYMELVCSMEDMLEVYGVKREEGKLELDWDCLENLLAWYLRVNSNNIQDFIVYAFVDVCFSLLSAGNNDKPAATIQECAVSRSRSCRT